MNQTTSPTSVDNPLLTVLIPTYNRVEKLRQALDNIADATRIPHRIIVIDGGSDDGTIELLESRPDVRTIFQGELLGTVLAYNAGFEIVDTPYAATLSDDTLVNDQGLDQAIAMIINNPEIGLVSLKASVMRDEYKTGYQGVLCRYGILNASFRLIDMAVARQIDFCSTDFRMDAEELDMTARVLAIGKKVVFTKRVIINHDLLWRDDPVDQIQARKQRAREGFEIYHSKFRWLGHPLARQSGVRKATRQFSKISSKLVPFLFRRYGEKFLDWYNIIFGRYISLFDSFRTRHEPYYLVQSMPAKTLRDPKNLWYKPPTTNGNK